MKTKTIEQTVVFDASPREVYRALVESKRHAAFTGARASITNKRGGKMSAYDGYVSGELLVLRPGKRLVQTWRSQTWPRGRAESILDIRLEPLGKKTRLTMIHSGVPPSLAKGFTSGWRSSYWKPLTNYLRK